MLIRNARIIDGTGAPATPPRDLLVEQGRIARIAPGGTLAPGDMRVLDAGGSFLIPGLMDLHAHEYRPELMDGFPHFGVTTIRDQGSPIGPLVASADAVAAGMLAGPRVDFGGIQFYTDWAYDLEDGQGVEPEADPDHLRRAVALAEAFGSAHIKTRTFRRWDINARFIAEARNKYSVTLNVETDEGRNLLKKIIPQVDILIENAPPGHYDSLGIGYRQLSENHVLSSGTIRGIESI